MELIVVKGSKEGSPRNYTKLTGSYTRQEAYKIIQDGQNQTVAESRYIIYQGMNHIGIEEITKKKNTKNVNLG